MNKSHDLTLAIEAARKAGEVIRDGFGKIQIIESKGAKGIVTETDKKAEQVIVSILQKSPYPILAEESGFIGEKSDTYWAVDPVDGTNNFSRNVDLIAVSIALIKENQVQLGVVYNPIKDHCYFAEKGQGAYCNDKKIQVSKNAPLSSNSIIIVEFGYGDEAKLAYKDLLAKVALLCRLRKFGSTAFELCFVAGGFYDAFLTQREEIWDVAAGSARMTELT